MREHRSGRLEQPALKRSLQTDVTQVAHRTLHAGQPLDVSVRTALEPRFGHDFSKVRIHADEHAAQTTDAFGARALTLGNEIAFAPGAYDVQSPFGLRVLAHELAHVAQNDRFDGDWARLEPQSRHGDAAETEAHTASKHALGGLNVQLNAMPSGLVSTWPDWLDDATSAVGGAVSGAVGTVTDTASSAYNTVSSAASDAASWAGDKASAAQDAAKGAVSWAGDKVNDATNWVGNKATDAAKWAGQKYDAGKKAVGDAASWAGGKVNDAEKWVGKKAHDAADWAGDKWDAGKKWVGDEWNSGKKWMGEKYDDTKGWLGDYSKGIGQEGLGGLFDPSGAVDRQRSQRELEGQFDIVADDFAGSRKPNQITKEEFDKVAKTYSNIRLGRGDLTINASELGNDSKGVYGMTEDQYKQKMMSDLATMMTTDVGRREVMGLSQNTMRDKSGNVRNSLLGFELPQLAGDADSVIGSPMHHHTTIRPLHQDTNANNDNSDDNANPLDYTNALSDPVNGGATFTDAKGNFGQGSDVNIRINPGTPITGTTSPTDVILAHEMAHSLHQTQGSMAPSTYVTAADGVPADVGQNIAEFEHQAAGLGSYASDPLTENAYRRERNQLGAGLQIRPSYSVLP